MKCLILRCTEIDERCQTKFSPLNAFLISPGQQNKLGQRAQRDTRDSQMLLSRRERFAIAAAASWAVLYLCGTPWINDDWSGLTSIQLRTGSPYKEQSPKQPSISCSLRAVSGPESQVRSQRTQVSAIRNRVLFTLGVLLVELCLNTTLDGLRKENRDSSMAGSLGLEYTELDEYELADRQSDRVYLDAGQSYGYAVQRCLRCEFPGRDSMKSFDFEQFRRHFFNGVVAPVHATYIMQCS